MNEGKYIKGFNIGYELGSRAPEIGQKLLEITTKYKDADYLSGVFAGQKEYEKEVLDKSKAQNKSANKTKLYQNVAKTEGKQSYLNQKLNIKTTSFTPSKDQSKSKEDRGLDREV